MATKVIGFKCCRRFMRDFQKVGFSGSNQRILTNLKETTQVWAHNIRDITKCLSASVFRLAHCQEQKSGQIEHLALFSSHWSVYKRQEDSLKTCTPMVTGEGGTLSPSPDSGGKSVLNILLIESQVCYHRMGFQRQLKTCFFMFFLIWIWIFDCSVTFYAPCIDARK